ncbi:MAG: DUF4097 family beta strand repeat protein [Deltaproteobacteria bacterium]|nr:DUF4097 family beta strand repeat protein [Deltaproteobacteria bacterium]
MKSKKRYISIIIFVAILLCAPSLIFANAKDKIEKSYAFKRDGRVTLQNVSGDVIVRGSKDDQVKITATHAGGAKNDLNEVVHITQTSGDIRIATHAGKSFGIFRSTTSVRYELLIPISAHVKIETTSANVEISGMGGALEVKTVSGTIKILSVKENVKCKTISGDIYLKDIQGIADLKTTSGDIHIHHLDGSIEAESVSGDMDLKNIDGEVDLKTTSGDVSISGMKGSLEAESVSGDIDQKSLSEINEIEMETISGDISAQGVLVPNGSYILGSHSGDIKFAAPLESNFELLTKTSNGDIDCDFDLKGYVIIDRKQLQGIVGKGGSSLNISTFSGNIHINKY